MKRAEQLLALRAPPAGATAPVGPAELCARCDPAQFAFDTTAALPQPTQPFGQTRAVDAVAPAAA